MHNVCCVSNQRPYIVLCKITCNVLEGVRLQVCADQLEEAKTNRYKLIIYIDVITLGVSRRFLWIKWASIIVGLHENSRLMLEGARRVWTQSGEWHRISITSMSNLHPWIELISIPAVILVWHSESKAHRYPVISPISHVYMCCSYTPIEFKINVWKWNSAAHKGEL